MGRAPIGVFTGSRLARSAVSVKPFIKRAGELAPSLVLWVFYASYLAFLSAGYARRYAVEDAGDTRWVILGGAVTGAVSLLLLGVWMQALILGIAGKRMAGSLLVFAAFAYALLCLYNWKTNSNLTVPLLMDHFRELRHREAWIMVSDQLSPANYLMAALVYAGLWLLEWKHAIFSRLSLGIRHLLLVGMVAGASWWSLLLWGPVTPEPITVLTRSAVNPDYHARRLGLIPEMVDLAEFPYVQNSEGPLAQTMPSAGRPNIFLVMIESFNARFVHERAADGSALMPRLRAAIEEGIWVEPFYANATYTVKGQEAVLTSLPPTLSGHLANSHEALRFHALPAVLRAQGYDTVFFQAYKNLELAGTGSFMRRCGFETVQALDRELAVHIDPQLFWGWGIQDDAFFERFFSWLEEREHPPRPSHLQNQSKPLFAMLATISSHTPHDQLPPRLCDAFPNPKSPVEWYANVLRQVDHGIGRFLDRLARSQYATNALVVMTSDHSIPMGEHGSHSVQAGFFEESFRIPCLFLWPGKLAPRRLTGEVYSQVDIAPTLLDLLGLRVPHHFTGQSLLRKTSAARSAVLVQPYDGLYLVARLERWKYVLHQATGREFIFDLMLDPLERINRLGAVSPELRLRLRREVGKLWLHHELLRQNRIWPGSAMPTERSTP